MDYSGLDSGSLLEMVVPAVADLSDSKELKGEREEDRIVGDNYGNNWDIVEGQRGLVDQSAVGHRRKTLVEDSSSCGSWGCYDQD